MGGGGKQFAYYPPEPKYTEQQANERVIGLTLILIVLPHQYLILLFNYLTERNPRPAAGLNPNFSVVKQDCYKYQGRLVATQTLRSEPQTRGDEAIWIPLHRRIGLASPNASLSHSSKKPDGD